VSNDKYRDYTEVLEPKVDSSSLFSFLFFLFTPMVAKPPLLLGTEPDAGLVSAAPHHLHLR